MLVLVKRVECEREREGAKSIGQTRAVIRRDAAEGRGRRGAGSPRREPEKQIPKKCATTRERGEGISETIHIGMRSDGMNV